MRFSGHSPTKKTMTTTIVFIPFASEIEGNEEYAGRLRSFMIIFHLGTSLTLRSSSSLHFAVSLQNTAATYSAQLYSLANNSVALNVPRDAVAFAETQKKFMFVHVSRS